jgi:hypothetical protein
VTAPSNRWLHRLQAGEAGVDDVIDAARRYVIEGCTAQHHDDRGRVTTDPAFCTCRCSEALEFAEDLAAEIARLARAPTKFKPAGDPGRSRQGEAPRPMLRSSAIA